MVLLIQKTASPSFAHNLISPT